LAGLAYAADSTLWSIEEAGWLRQWSEDGHAVREVFLNDLQTLWLFSADAS
jgi:hypothetical protein